MATLKQRIIDLTVALVTKLNALNFIKEEKSNKKSDLLSSQAEHYPNVGAVKTGLSTTLETSKTYTDSKVGAIPPSVTLTQKGAAGGVAELDSTGKVPTSQLPSYVDDVVDLKSFVTTNPTSGMVTGEKRYNSTTKKIFTSTSAISGTSTDPETDKIYINTSDEQVYRWSGTAMAQLAGGLVLGTTSTTAARGDQGAAAFNHISTTNNPHGVTASQIGLGLVNNTPDSAKPISSATQTALDLKANDNDVVKKAVVQDITGEKTFTVPPKSLQDGVTETQLIRKSQLDSSVQAVQNNLESYKTDEVGTDFPDYATQLTTGLNF